MTAPSRAGVWIRSPAWDVSFIMGPAFLAAGVCLLLPSAWIERPVTAWAWVALVLAVDVSHVYSTLFRTYFKSGEVERRPYLYWGVPLAAWTISALLFAGFGPAAFWRGLAYLAVFHFIRQQYGFLRIYSRGPAEESVAEARLSSVTLYTAALYPLLWWHAHLPREFHWFVEGDFARLPWLAGLDLPFRVFYLASLAAFLIKEIRAYRRKRTVAWGRVLIVASTAVSWAVGIIVLNGDLAFTATNVLAHGIPYLALVWQQEAEGEGDRRFFAPGRWPLYLAVLFLIAYLEEGLWAGLVWREHRGVFKAFFDLPAVGDPATLAWLVPLLALPQTTHYVLDGFIWRKGGVKSFATRPEA